jgi:1-acyl-sn-glycerol-3-phosphate acyltransferase
LSNLENSPPPVPAWFQNGFHRFLGPFLKRHFHCIAIDRHSRFDRSITSGEPLIVYANHPSWWDPLIAHFLNRALFPERQFYAPIDADALAKYRVFTKLGFYGVRLDSTSGAAAFLKHSMGIAGAANTSLWITPEGRFADPRDHEASLMPGLAHLCTRLDDGWVLPLALEYPFWDERLPECLVKLGEPFRIRDHASLSKPDWQEKLTERLRETQRQLGVLSVAKTSEPFDQLLKGKRGAGGFYDSLRRAKAWVTGDKFQAAHGDQFE